MKNTYRVNEEAVKKIAERVYDNGSTVINRNDLEEMFPELKEESEDEKIRQFLIHEVTETSDEILSYRNVNKKDVLTWLEKQCEHDKFRDSIQVGDKVTRNEDGALVNLSQLKRIAKPAEEYNITGIGSKYPQGKLGEMLKNLKPVNEVLEQKSAWSEEDEEMLDTVIEDIIKLAGPKVCYHKDVAYLKSLKERVQPKQEWNEEDEEMCKEVLTDIIYAKNDLEAKGCLGLSKRAMKAFNWFNKRYKSLRPQNTWKPSDEQIIALRWVLNNVPYNKHKEEISGLLDQIKDL